MSTPRTDALAKRFRESWNQFAYRSDEDLAKQCRNTDDAVTLARDLERENAAQAAAIAELRAEVEALKHDIERATQRNSDLIAEVEALTSVINTVMNIPNMSDADLAELKARCEQVARKESANG